MLIPGAHPAELDFGKIAFVDTETTGLSGGSGVCAFLVAIGYLTSDGFVVDQYLMQDFPVEPEMLRKVIEKLEDFDVIASYNGRAFDIPLLDTRLLLNSIRTQLAGRPQLDLLHPSRRIWKHRLRDCSLKSIEANVLDFFRIDDIDGWLIPETYFEYLRTGDRELLEPVISHNQLDVLSLAFIAQLLLAAVEAPEEAEFAYGLDWFGLGTLFEKHRRMEQAARCYERAMELDLPEEARPKCIRQLSLTHKRQGDWDSAVSIWSEETDINDEAHNLFALEELAKYYEHRARDLHGARDACRRAITMLEFRSATSISDLSHQFERFEYRLRRIERKIRQRNV
jgi:tetratricopeptide (TPR) repeat protein